MGVLSDCMCFDLFAVVVTLLIGALTYFKWKFSFWNKLGVSSLEPKIPFGNFTEVVLGQSSFGEQFLDFYKKFKAQNKPFGGVYFGPNPIFIPIDISLVKSIMQGDFENWGAHGGYVNEEKDPLTVHLFNLDGIKWRNLRVKLTPTFTSGKMKMMFHTITDCCEGMKEHMNNAAVTKIPLDIRDLLSRYGTDVIGSVAFGLDINSLKNPDDEFRKYGRRAVEMNLRDNIKVFMQVILPFWFLNLIGHRFIPTEVTKFFMKAIRETVDYRETHNIYRKDFMHLLIQLKNRGTVEDDEKLTDDQGNASERGLTMAELSAQAFIFFMAGYETSAATVSFSLYELAINQPIQDKLRKEIIRQLAKSNNELTYDVVMEMSYLDKVLSETLRKYPSLSIIMRECTKDYVIPGTNIELKKGMGTMIPVLGIHTDPDYYPEPEKFDPERFSEENKQTRPPFTWLPFGEGPRMCIGMRFGLLQSKMALITLLKDYKIELNEKTKLPIQMDKRSFGPKVAGGLWFNVHKL